MIAMNNQHEDLIIRGIVRPGDISSSEYHSLGRFEQPRD